MEFLEAHEERLVSEVEGIFSKVGGTGSVGNQTAHDGFGGQLHTTGKIKIKKSNQ